MHTYIYTYIYTYVYIHTYILYINIILISHLTNAQFFFPLLRHKAPTKFRRASAKQILVSARFRSAKGVGPVSVSGYIYIINHKLTITHLNI